MDGDNGFVERDLGAKARRGFTWSLANSLIRRLWTFALGIALARLLAPADFGVYAIALATLTILQSMNDLGVPVAVLRWQGDPLRAARTATTISIAVSVAMYAAVFALAPAIASALETPEASLVIRILTFAVVLDGFSGVPNALLERAFMQKQRMAADLAAIVVNAAVAVGLAVGGLGALSLAWGILAGNLVATITIILLAPSRPRPGYDPEDARALLKVGLPLAGASLLVFVMLNVDYFVVGGVLDATALGFYLLAFNLSSWPPNLFTMAIRSVSIPAFAMLVDRPDRLHARFVEIFGLVMTVSLPVSAMLSVLAYRVIGIVYGPEWLPAGRALVVLAALGAARVGLDLCYDLLVAMGRSRSVMWLQALWVAALIPTMLIGARWSGIQGAAVAHVVVAVAVVAPAFAIVLHRAGVPVRSVGVALVRPLVATAVMVGAVLLVDIAANGTLTALLVGGTTGAAVYLGLVVPWRNGRPDWTALVAVWRGHHESGGAEPGVLVAQATAGTPAG